MFKQCVMPLILKELHQQFDLREIHAKQHHVDYTRFFIPYYAIILDTKTNFIFSLTNTKKAFKISADCISTLEGGEIKMTVVKVGENENLESAIKRFKRKCQKDGIIGDIRRKEAYKKPSVKKKEKREAARKRARKRG